MMGAVNMNKELVQKLELIQKQRTGIEKVDVKEIMCRVRCNDVGYTLVQSKNLDCTWY